MKSGILIINCGSSSIKLAIIDPHQGRCYLSALVDNQNNPTLVLKQHSKKTTIPLETTTFEASCEHALRLVKKYAGDCPIIAIGHRVVHGGQHFSQSCLINPIVINAIEQCCLLAPLHNPVNLTGIKLAQSIFPDLPHVACFDTAFHQTLAAEQYLYPVPYDWYEQHDVRKYGFHGTSHRFVANQAIQKYQIDPHNHGILTLHLGNGCSLCAIKNGQSVDTTMGLTPLDGLMMGTRSGSIDPSLHQFMAHTANINIDDITQQLNKNSGLLGISGISHDMRNLHLATPDQQARAELAINMFCHIAAKQAAAMLTQLSQLDCLVFTGGIGENDAVVREKIINHLGVFNITINRDNNNRSGQDTQGILNDGTPLVTIIPTNEEWQIAIETNHILDSNHG